MAWPGTVADNKGAAEGYTPILMCSVTFQGTSTPLLLSTHPFDGVSGPAYPGVSGGATAGNYVGRIAEQDIETIQHRSQLGIDRVPRVTLHLYDADFYLYNNYAKVYGFRGAALKVWLILWEAGTTNFSTDSPLLFTGTCDMEVPRQGMSVLEVSANTGHNTATVKLPIYPIQNRCPHKFPTTAEQREAGCNDPSSPYFACGYSPDITGGVGNTTTPNLVVGGETITDGDGNYIVCDYLRSDPTRTVMTTGCMARLGDYAGVIVAPDGDLMHDEDGNPTGRFGGVQWSPGVYYAYEKNYTSNSKIPVFSFANSAIWGEYVNLLYGRQMLNCKVANVVESGNDTKCEAIICVGDISPGILNAGPHGNPELVLANGVQLGEAGFQVRTDPNLYWTFAKDGSGYFSTGGRNGVAARNITGYMDPNHNALGDPYGSVARIVCCMYKDIFTGFGTPTIQVRAHGPQLWAYVPIDNVSGSGTVLTVTISGDSYYFAGSGVWQIHGNSLSAANGQYTSWIDTPSSTVVHLTSAVTGSGTGGYLAFQFAGFNAVTTNPIWILADILIKSNWDKTEINWTSFSSAAQYCDQAITYTDSTGGSASHSRYRCSFSLDTRRTAAEIIAGILRGCNGYMYWDSTGLLNIGISKTLANSQPSPVAGSNYNTAVASIDYDGNAADGYAAFWFNDSNIAVTGKDEDIKLDLEWVDNATVSTPNQIVIQFQDEDNQYVVDSLSEIEPEAVTRAGGALQPGGSVVQDTPSILGIPNFDQAVRVANTIIAERQFGNEENDARGTRTCVIGTTAQVEHLRVGHLVLLSLENIELDKQLFRVTGIKPATDYQAVKITLQWENEIWRTDAYGQAPSAFYTQPGSGKPNRVPLVWQPYSTQPLVPSGTAYPQISSTEWTFKLAEIDDTDAAGTPLIHLRITGKLPINQISSECQPPRVPTSVSVSTTGGSIPGGYSIIVGICAIDASGMYSGISGLMRAVVPAGTNTNKITINNLAWDALSDGYDVFAGGDHFDLSSQASVTGLIGSMPSSIVITSLPNVQSYGPPDPVAAAAVVYVTDVIHAGIIGAAVVDVSGSTITLGAPDTGTLSNTLTGYKVMLLGRPNNSENDLPQLFYSIVSYTNSGSNPVLTLDRSVGSDIRIDDVVVICASANIATSDTIGDENFVSAYGPTGVATSDAGFVVRIIAGTGRYQSRLITSVTASGSPGEYDTYTVATPWDVTPDSTSMFIVEDQKANQFPVGAFGMSSLADKTVAVVDVDNLGQRVVLVQLLLSDGTENRLSNEARSPFRLIWLTGSQGTRGTEVSETQQFTDGTVEFDTSSGDKAFQLLSTSVVPNQWLLVRKKSADGNKVTVTTAVGDSFDDGTSSLELTDDAVNNKTLLNFSPSGVVTVISGVGSSSDDGVTRDDDTIPY